MERKLDGWLGLACAGSLVEVALDVAVAGVEGRSSELLAVDRVLAAGVGGQVADYARLRRTWRCYHKSLAEQEVLVADADEAEVVVSRAAEGGRAGRDDQRRLVVGRRRESPGACRGVRS